MEESYIHGKELVNVCLAMRLLALVVRVMLIHSAHVKRTDGNLSWIFNIIIWFELLQKPKLINSNIHAGMWNPIDAFDAPLTKLRSAVPFIIAT